jgi:MoaA/NifB/PqqE/SkfB family radical SAM enzyme
VEECGAPMVSIPGGEPLMHPQIDEIVEGLVARKKYIYLCTNALLLKEKSISFKPSKYLTFSRPSGWPAGASRFFRVPRRRL